MSDKQLLIDILQEIENKLNMRGFKGYGVGHPHARRVRLGYGRIDVGDEEKKQEKLGGKVKVSRAFKRK